MYMDLTGKRALVTGSSRGIGSAIAIGLAEGGADIVLHCASRIEKAQEVKEKIERLGRRCEVFQADLCDPHNTDGVIEKIGPVDILVLNASLQYRKKWEQITLEEAYQQINCNFVSSLRLIQQAVPAMREKHWGRIITIGSVQEAKPHPDMLVYSSTKAAQTTMAKSLSLQLAPDHITVNNVAPGVIYTDRNVEALSDEAYAKFVTSTIPLRYYGEKEDLAGIVRLLCSEEGRYITGQSIYVDGGKSL